MKHLIMGTAGHIDHGKTALVKALTNIECDTHSEEKKRGITIHLGFAHMALPDGGNLGIVDVPGHKDFIHTMVGGASGIDFVLLTVAADSGIMPQTREHIRIMNILKIKKGIIAITKSDLADEEIIELVKEDVAEFVKESFLENAPVITVSAKTGAGIEELKKLIFKTVERIENRPEKGVFRMFVDRIFSVSGFGTVVTGSVLSGCVKTGDTVYLIPGKVDELRVRRIEKHGAEVNASVAGDRCSINIAGLEKSAFRRGMVISDRLLRETSMADGILDVFDETAKLKVWSDVIFYAGTYEHQARVHLLDRDSVKSGESALVQIHLSEPCVLKPGDRFVIRNTSGDMTLGGGEIIDVSPLHHKRRKSKIINDVGKLASGSVAEKIAVHIGKFNRAVSTYELGFMLNISDDEINDLVSRKLPNEIVRFETKDGFILHTKSGMDNVRKGILKAIADFKKKNPLASRGANFDEIRGFLKFEKNSPDEEILRQVLNNLTEKEKLKEKEKTWTLANDMTEFDAKTVSNINDISKYTLDCGMQVPLMSQMLEMAQKMKITEKALKQILHHLTVTGVLYRISEEYVHKDVVDGCRNKLVDYLSTHNEGITVAQFRDLVGGNRKMCLLLISQYDSEKITVREGDYRFLNPKFEGVK